jgi:hypothetical protein
LDINANFDFSAGVQRLRLNGNSYIIDGHSWFACKTEELDNIDGLTQNS